MLAGLCLLMSCRAPANKEEYQLQDHAAFVFEGKPINPKIIERFLPWESDLYPSVLVVDLSSANSSNEFSSNFVEKGKGLFSYKSADGKIFGYKTIGKLSNLCLSRAFQLPFQRPDFVVFL